MLIQRWPTLRAWLDEDRDGILLHRRLGDAARLWQAGGRQAGDLYPARGSTRCSSGPGPTAHR